MKRSAQAFIAMMAFACAATQAAPIAVEGTPEMTIYWNNGIGGPTRTVGTVAFTTDEEGNFYSGSESFTWSWTNPLTSQVETDTINVSFAGGNYDPVITIGVGFVDFGTPSVFSFAVSSPLAPPVTGLANYKLDLSGSFADGGSDGGSMSLGTASYGIMDGQLDFASFAGIGGAIGSFPAGTSTPFSFTSVNGIVNCGAGCNDFGLFLSAKGSGGNDAMSFTGRLEITPVPVPAAAWMLGGALAVLGATRRRMH